MPKHSQEQNEKSENRKRSDRKRYLNIIYFIDSRRTRTIKFSIGKSYLTVGILATCVIWSLFSSVLLIRDRLIISELQDHARDLLNMVFTYQTRYDEVYEKAYPTREAAPSIADADAKPDSETETEAETKIRLAAEASKKAMNPKEKVVSQAPPAKEEDPPVSIANFSTEMNASTLTVRLSLKNLSSPSRASGTITASARYLDAANQTSILQSIPGKSSDVEDAGGSTAFNIRYFKNRTFAFEVPKDKPGKFLSITIAIEDSKGRRREHIYAMNKDPQSLARPAQAQVEDVEESNLEQSESESQ